MTEKGGWFKAVRGGKTGFDKLWGYADKLGAPVNKLTNKIGSEAFWPTSIDKESYKAARILRSFCKDGVYSDEMRQTDDGPKQKQSVIKKIPAEVIKNAKGLAIFTTMRTGLWFSGAGGSGVLVARMEDGTWSPPSGILLHTAAIGFLVGVDIYDCVLVLNNQEAVNAFAKWRFTLGGEMSAVAGPIGVGGILDSEVHARRSPIFTYLRSRGFYAGVQIDGTVIIERTDENEKYYGYKYSAIEITSGKVLHPPKELKVLAETLKAAQGDLDVDESILPVEPPPADYEVVKSDHVFGIPDKEDPDPFGVLALEKEGFQIKEAGSQAVVASEEFEFKPSATSPIFDTYNRGSFDSNPRRESWRNSSVTVNSMDRRYVTIDMSTQTDFAEPTTPMALTPAGLDINNPLGISTDTGVSNTTGANVADSATQVSNKRIPPTLPSRESATPPARPISMPKPIAGEDGGYSATEMSNEKILPTLPPRDPVTPPAQPIILANSIASEDEGSSEEEDDEEPVIIQEIQQAARPQMIVKPRVISVPARMRPNLPARNPSRMSAIGTHGSNGESQMDGEGVMKDPTENTSRTSLSDKVTLSSQDEHRSEESVTSTTPPQTSVVSVPIADGEVFAISSPKLESAVAAAIGPKSEALDSPKVFPVDVQSSSPTTGGSQEQKPATQSSPRVSLIGSGQTPWRSPSQRFGSPRASPEAVRSGGNTTPEPGQYRPFSQRFSSPRTSLELVPAEVKTEIEHGQWQPSSQRFSLPSSSPRTSMEAIAAENEFLSTPTKAEARSTRFSLLGTSMETASIAHEVEIEPKPSSPISGPRISLASMKLRLDDDDDDDDDDDYDGGSSIGRRISPFHSPLHSPIHSPVRSAGGKYDEDFS